MNSRILALFCALVLSALLLQGCPSNNNSPTAPAPVTVVELVTATFTPTGTPTSTPPPAVIDGYFTTNENSALILSNSDLNTLVTLDPNGDPLIFIFPGTPDHGTVSLTHLSHTNTITYTPNSGFYGVDSFAYYVHDQFTLEDSSVQAMVITVSFVPTATPTSTPTATSTATSTPTGTPTPVPAPVLSNGFFTGTENTTLFVNALSVASLVTLDPNGDPLTFSPITSPLQGILTLNPDGSFTYMPNSDFTGTDIFNFRAYDGTTSEYSNTAAITITVNP